LLFFDGAMGTMLEGSCPKGELPEFLNVSKPEVVINLHKRYLKAGADVITANTFGANRIKLKGSGYSVERIVEAAAENAVQAIQSCNLGEKFIALDIGSIGQLLDPNGTLSFEEAVDIFSETVRAGVNAGVDIILIETVSDLYELKAAVIAAKENCDLPIIVSMTVDNNGRTFMGCDAATFVAFANAIGVSAIGINCGQGFDGIKKAIEVIVKYSRTPVIVMPNAGKEMNPKKFADTLISFYEQGVSIFGGCCGTTPGHISEAKKELSGKKIIQRKPEKETTITSGNRTAAVSRRQAPASRITVIGERINPSGKPLLIDALKKKDYGVILDEALAQIDEGAEILDINCGYAGIKEAEVLAEAVKEIQSIIPVPLMLDSADYKALERAARVYNGKPVINSLSGKKESLDNILPIVKKYGAAVVGMCLDENGIPETAERRVEIAGKIIAEAESRGIPREDIILDCVCTAAMLRQENLEKILMGETVTDEEIIRSDIENGGASVTLKAVSAVKKKYGVKTVLGISNISYGMPDRSRLNKLFLDKAADAGLDAAIINTKS